MSLMRTKPVEDVLAQNREEPGAEASGGDGQGRLRKRLGPLDLMGFGIGIVIGTGIFTLTGVEAKHHAGPAIVHLVPRRRRRQRARRALLRRARRAPSRPRAAPTPTPTRPSAR